MLFNSPLDCPNLLFIINLTINYYIIGFLSDLSFLNLANLTNFAFLTIPNFPTRILFLQSNSSKVWI